MIANDKIDTRSQCYKCKYYDWFIEFGQAGTSKWQHVCLSPLRYEPGDNVRDCPGFDKEKDI